MAKLHHVKKARKTKRKHGIVRGQPYWWLKRRAPGQRAGYKVYFSKRPRPSQVEGNPFRKAVLALEESVQDADVGSLAEALHSVAEELRALAQEQEDKLGNMPEALQDSDTGEMLRNRAEQCEAVADELESAADEIEGLTDDDNDGEEAGGSSATEKAREIADGVSWDID